MRVKLIINTWIPAEGSVSMLDMNGYEERVEVWSGEIDIKEKNVYLTKVSLIAEGQEHPICDIPFSLMHGYWQWVPPDVSVPEDDDEYAPTLSLDTAQTTNVRNGDTE